MSLAVICIAVDQQKLLLGTEIEPETYPVQYTSGSNHLATPHSENYRTQKNLGWLFFEAFKYWKCFNYRVYRVPGFLSSRPNWVPPPHMQASVAPPLWVQGGTLVCGGWVGDPIPKKGQTLWCSLYTIIPRRF